MDSQPDVSARLDELASAISRLERRVHALEHAEPRAAVVEAAADAGVRVALPPARGSTLDLTLVGRSLIVLGGAFLLRAIANLPSVPDGLGVGLGLAYAATLLGLADRAAARGREADSACHGFTALLVAYPLVGEMMLRFHVLDAWAGSLAVTAWFAVAILLAARRRAVALAWIVTGGTVIAVVALGFATRMIVPYAWAFIALAAVTAWLGHRLGQRGLVWPVAIAGDLMLLVVLAIAFAGRATWGLPTAPLLGLAWFLVFAGGAMARATVDASPTTIPEMIQTGLALVVGFAGGAATAVAQGAGGTYGGAGVALAVAGTAATLRWLAGDRRTVGFWTSFWSAAALVALATTLRGTALALAWVAVGMTLLALGSGRRALARVQALVALSAAAVASGLFACAWRGLTSPLLEPPTAGALVVLAALAVTTFLLLREGMPDRSRFGLGLTLTALATGLFSLAGVVALAVIGGLGASPPLAAAVRTALLAAAAVGCAAASRTRLGRDAGLLVYPLLLAGAAKLLFEDFGAGVPATQFAGLAMYGVAVIVAPRLRRREA